MGDIRHRAMVVTSWDRERLTAAHTKAAEFLGHLVSPVIESTSNGYVSFFTAPDGSNLGWVESDFAETSRVAFMTWLDTQRYDDGSSPFAWVEVQYGDEEQNTKIVCDSDHRAAVKDT